MLIGKPLAGFRNTAEANFQLLGKVEDPNTKEFSAFQILLLVFEPASTNFEKSFWREEKKVGKNIFEKLFEAICKR